MASRTWNIDSRTWIIDSRTWNIDSRTWIIDWPRLINDWPRLIIDCRIPAPGRSIILLILFCGISRETFAVSSEVAEEKCEECLHSSIFHSASVLCAA